MTFSHEFALHCLFAGVEYFSLEQAILSMLVIFQVPILDLRRFTSDTGRLRKPTWPIPDPNLDFVRNSGAIAHRPLGGIQGWVGEDLICNAKKAVRFDYIPRLPNSCQDDFKIAFRRFYFDGHAVGKYEIGFATIREYNTNFSEDDIEKLLTNILNLSVRIPIPMQGHFRAKLLEIGPLLAKMYLQATTKVDYPEGPPRDSLVRSGTPMLLMELNEDFRDGPYAGRPFNSQELPLNHQKGIALAYAHVKHSAQWVNHWFLRYSEKWGSGNSEHLKKNVRRLRIYLQRLHAEHECLRLTLRALLTRSIDIPTNSDYFQAFQHYLNESTRRIGILQNKTARQFDDSIYELARNATSAIRSGELSALNSVLDRLNLRPNLRRKVDRYTEECKNITIIKHMEHNYQMGDTYKDIHNSIITTRESIAEGLISIRTNHEDRVADQIQKLDELIISLNEQELSPEKKNDCLELLNALTNETKKPSPSKPVLKTIGETLANTLSHVASISKAVTECFAVLKVFWS